MNTRKTEMTDSRNNRFIDIDSDGLPCPGVTVYPGDILYTYADSKKYNSFSEQRFKGSEKVHLDKVTLIQDEGNVTSCSKAWIRIRINRNPLIGDKFASRAGQKGILSQIWCDVDMPYSSKTGIRPDLLINPNAFPSRMTIGMLIESLTSKAGVIEGKFVDSSPFKHTRGLHPYETFCEILENRGFSRNGEETLISGISGEELHCNIFIGCVYYQRLRQMISDKFQFRNVGPMNQFTKQPIKGSKFGGGIRFGEMERDSLLAHGAAYLLHDRLHISSDYSSIHCCRRCGSILSVWHDKIHKTKPPIIKTSEEMHSGTEKPPDPSHRLFCWSCNSSLMVESVAVPYVLKFLAVELASVNIKLRLEIR
jgi:DNA-directed RNA polymerase I subunit RPA2